MGVTIPFKRPDGEDASGYLAHSGVANAPSVVVIQEWWGLQDQIKGLADRFAAAGFDAGGVGFAGAGFASRAGVAPPVRGAPGRARGRPGKSGASSSSTATGRAQWS